MPSIPWIEHTDYFPDFATRLIDEPAWAMVAAASEQGKSRKLYESILVWG